MRRGNRIRKKSHGVSVAFLLVRFCRLFSLTEVFFYYRIEGKGNPLYRFFSGIKALSPSSVTALARERRRRLAPPLCRHVLRKTTLGLNERSFVTVPQQKNFRLLLFLPKPRLSLFGKPVCGSKRERRWGPGGSPRDFSLPSTPSLLVTKEMGWK